MAKVKQYPSQEVLRYLFDVIDGNLVWKVDRGRKTRKGSIAGYTHPKYGYIDVKFDGSSYKAHRLVYIWYNGDIPDGIEIDHINRQRADNRIENLRLVTKQENSYNRESKGYYWHKKDKRFIAQIQVEGTWLYLGSYIIEEEAKNAYKEAKIKYHIIKGK